jgi:hypothetical protein
MRESSELMTRKEREELEKAAAAERRKIEALTKGFGISREQAEAAVVAGISPDKLMPKEKDPYQQYLESLPPDKREQAFAVKAGLAARPGSGTSINIDMPPGITAFDRELGKKDAVQYDTWRSNAVSASQTLERIQPIKEILSSVQTGKIPEALAIAGQYFGTDAAADLQTLRAAIQPIVLSQVKQLGSGNGITDADRKFIQDGMPGFGNDPRANERVVRIMENSARANVRLFEEADDFITKNGSLRGFRPSVTFAPQSVGGPGDGKEGAGKYTVGQTINFGGKRYRVKSIDPSNPDDPELEEI